MAVANNVLYSPYGAYELKSSYQRNFMVGTGSVIGLVLFILIVTWLISVITAEDLTNIPEVRIKTIAELGPPPSLIKKPPQVQIQQAQVVAPKIGIPKPVADEEVHILLFEPASTVNTGEVENELTRTKLERI